MINLNRLEGFYWVAREGGYSAAARACPRDITQPAIHQQVRRLEEELEVELLERAGHRRVRLTAAGARLYAYCRAFFEGLPDVMASLHGERRRLRIEAAGLVIHRLLPSWLQRVRRARHDLELEVGELDSPDLDRLRSGELDLIIDHLPSVPPDITTHQVAVAHPFIVVPRGHPHDGGLPALLASLEPTPLVCYPPSFEQHALQMAAVRENIGEPTQTIAASSVEVILSFVAAGLGYSIVPWLDEKGPRRAGVVAIAPGGHDQRFPILAAWSKRSPIAPTLRQVVELLSP